MLLVVKQFKRKLHMLLNKHDSLGVLKRTKKLSFPGELYFLYLTIKCGHLIFLYPNRY